MSVKDHWEFYQNFDKLTKEYILSHSKITEDEYREMERHEWYMTSDEMLSKGLVDEVI